ncbi:endolytic transglycosylase MltG [Streptomyces sp. NPDC048720]|uniref:endolytic transglycosylase MltG n=1 Tax=Streptomyces sp. NPDC048720 TaxID=3365588 RepID=UPI003719BEE3
MQMNTPPRSTMRLTRRGKLALVVTGAVLAGTAVAVPLLSLAGGRTEQVRPRTLVIPEGRRASQVYEAVDKALELPPGSTRKSLGKAGLKLPKEAAGNPEGYLFPGTYPLAKGATPESLLRLMVGTAGKKFDTPPVAAGAQRNTLNVYQTVIVASIVQAESTAKADMGKVARVILNRLQRGMPLQVGTTLNYALNRTGGNAGDHADSDSPYNSYRRVGLPPTPIGNPGPEAMRAVTNPPSGDWLYYVTVKPGDTRFTADYAEHVRNVTEFSARHQSPAPSPQPSGSGSGQPAAPQPPR